MTDRTTYRIACSMVVRDADGRVLIVREGNGGPRVYGKLNLPGGHLDPGETPAECAAREVAEETGLHVAPSALLGIYYIQDGGLNIVFLGRSDSTTTRPGEDVLSCEWLTPGELESLPDAQIFRVKKMRAIISDLLKGTPHSIEAIRTIEKEEWERG